MYETMEYMKFFFLFQIEVCQKLWCYKGGQMCETKFLPAADGTSCGHGMVGRHNFLCKHMFR